ncbi:hypothetical protein F5X99DRAFT_395667 [Biscogniauxia marginata]|nr:hypothetical protein F5X99DRAFT_395667 [Biscogniauxia marginata]
MRKASATTHGICCSHRILIVTMNSFTATLIALLASSPALAQSLPPSPTASVGCEPHGDHWHCDGPATITSVSTMASGTHDHTEGSEVLPPSPTESVGCEPHGDHWHCNGPASTNSLPPITTTSHSHDDEETGTLAPSPTESVGCEPHGDHWHCDGPAITSGAANNSTSVTASTTATAAIPTGGAGVLAWNTMTAIGAFLFTIGLTGAI